MCKVGVYRYTPPHTLTCYDVCNPRCGNTTHIKCVGYTRLHHTITEIGVGRMWPDKKHGRVLVKRLGGGLEVWRCLGCPSLPFQLRVGQDSGGNPRGEEVLRFGVGIGELTAWARRRRSAM